VAPFRNLALGMVLTACAGIIDAIGFIELGGFYTSFMSGNTTQLGILAAGAGALALPLALVVVFFAGSFAGSLLGLRAPQRGPQAVLGLVTTSLLLSLSLSMIGIPPTYALLPLAFGAGAQNAVVPFHGGARLGTTFVSGTLFAAGQDLAGAVEGVVPPWRWVQHLSVWAALLAGALIGAILHGVVGVFAVLVPVAVYLGLLILFAAGAPLIRAKA
jgi:uncharacterized membrane protein YoaK (UPF0700 family)